MEFSLLALFLPAEAGAEQERPNILFAFADDWGCYASAYASLDKQPSANDVVHTPHFDRLAQSGVLFKHAFVTAPSCTPCRSSLLCVRSSLATVVHHLRAGLARPGQAVVNAASLRFQYTR